MLSQLSYIPMDFGTQCVTAKGTLGELFIFCQVLQEEKG